MSRTLISISVQHSQLHCWSHSKLMKLGYNATKVFLKNLEISTSFADLSTTIPTKITMAIKICQLLDYLSNSVLWCAMESFWSVMNEGIQRDVVSCLPVLGVGMMLKGGGTVPPSSKYEIHSLDRANFHSVSAFSCNEQLVTVQRGRVSDKSWITTFSSVWMGWSSLGRSIPTKHQTIPLQAKVLLHPLTNILRTWDSKHL